MSTEELRSAVKAARKPVETGGSMKKQETIDMQMSAMHASQQQQLEILRAENQRLREEQARMASLQGPGVSFKVTVARAPGTNGVDDKGSEGGAVSVYGLQRFPVTLHKETWERLLDKAEELRAFMKKNDGLLKKKSR